mmetsp:Transcript_68869/g.211198  ORF Transcript_68869/g.211198 Transcript_68869/m.211198 type:complete len:503 (+) Transcript_68869:309-1817(+)
MPRHFASSKSEGSGKAPRRRRRPGISSYRVVENPRLFGPSALDAVLYRSHPSISDDPDKAWNDKGGYDEPHCAMVVPFQLLVDDAHVAAARNAKVDAVVMEDARKRPHARLIRGEVPALLPRKAHVHDLLVGRLARQTRVEPCALHVGFALMGHALQSRGADGECVLVQICHGDKPEPLVARPHVHAEANISANGDTAPHCQGMVGLLHAPCPALDALEVVLERLLDRMPRVVQQRVIALEFLDVKVLVMPVLGRSPHRVRVPMELIQLALIVAMGQLHMEPRRRFRLERRVARLHHETLFPDRFRRPIQQPHRRDVSFAKFRRTEEIELLHTDPHLLLKRAPPQPQSYDLREMNHLGQFLLGQRSHHRWILLRLDAQVEVRAVLPRQIANDDVFQLHRIRRDANPLTHLPDEVGPTKATRAARPPGEDARPIAVAGAEATEERPPDAVQRRRVDPVVAGDGHQDPVPIFDHQNHDKGDHNEDDDLADPFHWVEGRYADHGR